jgi:Alpha/beta hydrolase domain
MCLKKNWLSRYLVPAIAILGAAIGWSSPSYAFVQWFVIDSTQTANFNPLPLGSSTPGSPVSYTIYTGRIFGALNPSLPQNAVITDIGLASPVYALPAPPSGDATYISQFSIVTPTDPTQRSGLLIYEVSNRGNNAIPITALVQGATYVQSGWQGDLLAQCSGVNSLPAKAYPCQSLSFPYGTPSASFPFFTPPSGLTDFVIQVPVATFDRNPPLGSNTITGPVYSHIHAPLAGSPASSTTQQLVLFGSAFTPYQPAGAPMSMSTSNAQFWYDQSQSTDGVDTGKTLIPSDQWSWADCPSGSPGTSNPTWICLNGGFNPNYLYEISFTAQDPLVQGVGFAATRDLVSFLRYGTADAFGDANPLAGTVSKAMIIGVSQSGAYDRSLVAYGFNEDESNRIVFDGDWAIISARIIYMNERWGQANVLSHLYMGSNEAPAWWADWPNVARGLPAAGMLDRCRASNTCPQVLDTWGGNEFYISKESATLVGYCQEPPSSIACTTEIPQPANVYRYYAAGATHNGSTVNFNWCPPGDNVFSLTSHTCTTYSSTTAALPTSAIPEAYTNNALQYAFIGLLGCNPKCGSASIPMPPSVSAITYPSFESGQLVPATNHAAVGFTNIPIPALQSPIGINPTPEYSGNQAWPSFVYDFGPQCTGNDPPISMENDPARYCIDYRTQSGVPTIAPPTIQKVLTAYVPTVGSDDNENVGGLPTVLGQAPTGSYISWNVIPTGPYAGQAVELNAGYWPFYETAAERTSVGDPRLSLEERYGTNAGYICVATQAVNNAASNGYLLPSDQAKLLADISGSNVLSGFSPTTADTNLANHLCAIANLAASYGGAAPSLNLGIDTYYALIDLGASNLNWNGPIAGNVLVGHGLRGQLSGNRGGRLGGGAIVSNGTNIWAIKNGAIFSDRTADIQAPPDHSPPTLPVPKSVTSAALTAAQAVSSYAASLPATVATTMVSGNFDNGSTTVTGNGGLNVIYVDDIRNTRLTLSGSANDIFVINVSGGIKNLAMTLSGGVTASHVLFNLTGNSGNVLQTGGDSVLYGTYLATHGGQFECAQLNLTGALINTGGDVHLVAGPSMTFAPFTFSD